MRTNRIAQGTQHSVRAHTEKMLLKIGELVKTAKELGIPIISSMGTGNKLNISDLKVTDIFKTSMCPLCKVMRKRLRDEKIDNLEVVYSEETPRECTFDEEGKRVPSSMVFVPAAAGLLLAETVVKRLII